ncbi:MAG: efflux RND transporter periplasmic adaptor subunit [Planctomycetes bacterium]|nr:efflux RND transporter periplasmic adaptor subunit [Planctomycetota bacterium]
MRVRIDRVVALGLGVLLATGFLWTQRTRPRAISGESGRAAAATPSERRRVRTEPSRQVGTPIVIEAMGTVRSRRQVEIASRVLAEVKEVRKQPGDAVDAGEILVVLDGRDVEARVAQGEATLRSREEALHEATTENERTRRLFAKEASTQREVDLAGFRLAAATAEREAASKALDEARIQLTHTVIVAPFAGVILEKRVEPGDLASPGAPLLGLYDPNALRLEAEFDEGLLPTLAKGQSLEVAIDALARTIQGQVSEVVPAVDPSSRTATVKVDLGEAPGLRPGMFGRARTVRSTRSAILVPLAALVVRGQLEMVFTVAADKRHARMLLVRAGKPIGEDVEILSGLESGTAVVVTDAARLRDGVAIDLDEATIGPAPKSEKENRR